MSDYHVGYGKPPKHSRFKRGRSGNPRGRRRGGRNFKTDIKAALEAPVKVTRNGKPHKLSTQKAMLLRLREKALGGDVRALDRLILLAQTYNDDEPAADAALSVNDANVLQVYRARVLGGASEPPDQIEENEGAAEGGPSSGSTDLSETAETGPIKRVRLKSRWRSRNRSDADDVE